MVDLSFEKNIKLYYVYAVLSRAFLFLPIMSLYYKETFGLSYFQIILIQVIFSVVAIACEMPSGFFADIVGRKNIVIFGLCISLIAIFLFAVSISFIHLCIASMLAAVSNACISGADSALLFESLSKIGKEKSYIKITGKMSFIAFLVVSFFALPTGYIAKINMRLPYWLTLIPVCVALIAFCGIKETFTKEKHSIQNANLHSICSQAVKSWKHIFDNSILLYLVCISAFTIFIIEFGHQVYQLHFASQGLKIRYFGLLFFILGMGEAMAAKCAHLLSGRLTKLGTISFILLLIAIGFTGMAFWKGVYGAVISYSLICIARGAAGPIFQDFIHSHISDEVRASILSSQAFMNRLFFIAVGLTLAIIADNTKQGLLLIFASIGICLYLLAFIVYFGGLRIKNHQTKVNRENELL